MCEYVGLVGDEKIAHRDVLIWFAENPAPAHTKLTTYVYYEVPENEEEEWDDDNA